jgi:hypothetical protein
MYKNNSNLIKMCFEVRKWMSLYTYYTHTHTHTHKLTLLTLLNLLTNSRYSLYLSPSINLLNSLYIYMYIYIYIHTYIYMHTHTYIHTYMLSAFACILLLIWHACILLLVWHTYIYTLGFCRLRGERIPLLVRFFFCRLVTVFFLQTARWAHPAARPRNLFIYLSIYLPIVLCYSLYFSLYYTFYHSFYCSLYYPDLILEPRAKGLQASQWFS